MNWNDRSKQSWHKPSLGKEIRFKFVHMKGYTFRQGLEIYGKMILASEKFPAVLPDKRQIVMAFSIGPQ
jgi:hypothetical protein